MTTKQAVLPSGEVMHFPPETPDEHIHAQVRQRLGMGPPEITPRPTADQFGAVLGHLKHMGDMNAGTVGMLQQVVERATQAYTSSVQELMRNATEARQLNAQMAEAIHRVADLAGKIEVSHQAVIKALRAKKTITRSKEGGFSMDVGND